MVRGVFAVAHWVVIVLAHGADIVVVIIAAGLCCEVGGGGFFPVGWVIAVAAAGADALAREFWCYGGELEAGAPRRP